MQRKIGSAFVLIALFSSASFGASPQEVTRSINRGASYLKSVVDEAHGGKKTLIALAMMKGNIPKNDPAFQAVVKEVLEKFEGGKYKPGGEHLYEAGVEATLLADLDPVKYKPQIQLLADYILGHQMATGGWDYPTGGHPKESVGDTSVMQYACLGLWAASRAGVEIDQKVWVDILDWHVKYQNKDGGFAYIPGLKIGDGNGDSTINMSVNAVGSMHIAMLQLNPTYLPFESELRAQKASETEAETKRFGILETVKIDDPQVKTDSARIPAASVNSVRRVFGFVTNRFRVENKETGWAAYYYYSLERMAALANVKQIGNRDWFNECADFLIKKQKDDGSWSVSRNFAADVDTAFAVLFLTRSTGRLLKRVDTPKFGDGLLAGGRGLPDDLTDVDFNGRSVKMKEPPTEPLDILLASLSKTGGLENLDAVQEQIVEQVQLGNREDLIGQVDQLLKLIDHPDPDIRQTVVWALGRTGNMNLAQHLIDKLSDENLYVMIEARNALCWISRKPLGFGFPEDPLQDLSTKATDEQKRAAISLWHKNLVLTWGDWYLKNRPFEDRGDAFEAELRQKMEKLKYGF
ncbi:HEAT repeat domain-containing protein [Thalassoglobus polymorphus]|uniref:Prenyltransferase and squalene oxidase repeat protein n=1 Tax=Thalassoglobus polymorphus TaxID=2527994 RepID=A0A517QM24_9PLAN|nr:HEAT repeat domain-containing protein [Thalassoglobus polymorphus]QDT32651.1 Prenyltransferase and squalene oxidase repeat protein [Thalassoglobus polymorphus]